MSDEQQNRPAAGFYPDPSGGPARRWWDGTAWTGDLEGSQGSAPIGPDGRPVQPELAPGTKVDTAFIWIFCALPLVSLLALGLYDFGDAMRRSVAAPTDPFAVYTPGYFALMGAGLLVYAASVLLAFLDHRTLRAAGIVRPFHWAWTFLSSLAYAIGRGVVLRRRVGRGLAPMWAFIAVTAVTAVVSISIVVGATVSVIGEMGFSAVR